MVSPPSSRIFECALAFETILVILNGQTKGCISNRKGRSEVRWRKRLRLVSSLLVTDRHLGQPKKEVSREIDTVTKV
jgi:hypothetical protein